MSNNNRHQLIFQSAELNERFLTRGGDACAICDGFYSRPTLWACKVAPFISYISIRNMTTSLKKDEEELMFKRRLLYDGHGSGEDKRLINILRNVTRFCLKEESPEDTAKLLNCINKDITAALQATDKHSSIVQMCDKNIESLDQAIGQKYKDILSIKDALARLRLDLDFVIKVKSINQYPDCQTTEKTIEQITNKRKELLDQIDKQKSCLKILVEACNNLRKVFEDDKNDLMDIELANV